MLHINILSVFSIKALFAGEDFLYNELSLSLDQTRTHTFFLSTSELTVTYITHVVSVCVCVGKVLSSLWGTDVPTKTVKPEITYIVESADGPHEENGFINILNNYLKINRDFSEGQFLYKLMLT